MNIFRPGIFDGHVAIVTGGGSGIGLSTAVALGELGAKVAICGRKMEKLEKGVATLKSKGIKVLADTCDIREVEQINAFVDKVGADLGRATVLVNNAGGQFPAGRPSCATT
jgi:citronellol/citronellal dehydrogenase